VIEIVSEPGFCGPPTPAHLQLFGPPVPTSVVAANLERTPPELSEELKVVVAKAEEAKVEDIISLPREAIRAVDTKVLTKKISTDTVAKLNASEIEKIPTSVRAEKAWEFSIWDSFKPGMESFLSGVSDTTASGYLGTRYAHSLALNDPLMSQVSLFGLIFEMRGSWLDGLRLYYDLLSKAEAPLAGDTQSLEMSRILAAYAFDIDIDLWFDKIHLVPRVGQYNLSARLPGGIHFFSREILLKNFAVDNALATGAEVDIEKSSLFYILRAWYAQDLSLGGGAGGVTSQRMGIDAFLKGSGFSLLGQNLSTSYLAFVANESLTLKDEDETLGSYSINLSIPYAGLGLSLSW
jgi:hypothetical protein